MVTENLEYAFDFIMNYENQLSTSPTYDDCWHWLCIYHYQEVSHSHFDGLLAAPIKLWNFDEVEEGYLPAGTYL